MERPQWDSIDTVLLDLDGTLLDRAYDNFVWLGRVPEIFAEQNGLSLAEAQAALAPKFRDWAGKLEWYCIDFWSRELALDVAAVHRAEAHRVAWLPGARRFLETLRERGKKLVLLTNTAGVLDKAGQLLTNLSARQIDGLFADGTISGGMLPKIAGALDAAKSGVNAVHIIDGRVPHAMLLEVLSDQAFGTMIRSR